MKYGELKVRATEVRKEIKKKNAELFDFSPVEISRMTGPERGFLDVP